MLFYFASFVLSLAVSFTLVDGHGRLIDPPNRSSLWRFPDDAMITPYKSLLEPNYNDNQLFCGGAQYQAARHGRCGVCGDPVDAVNPENVPPNGKYAKGIIVRQYSQGSSIPITVEITTHHKGYFEFRLCPWNDVTSPITHECLNENLLRVTNTGLTQYDITTGQTGMFHLNIKLPDAITCDQCVLQWRYHTGNTWGCDAPNDCDTGKGPQEEFYGCADIAIGTNPVVPPPSLGEGDNTVTTTTATTTTSTSGGAPSQTSTVTSSTTSSPSTTTSATTSSTTTSTSSGSSNENSACNGNENGYVKIDCYSFYRCANGIPYKIQCAAGTMFDETTNTCDYEDKVICT